MDERAGELLRALVGDTDVGGRPLPTHVEVYEHGPGVRVRWTYADGAAFVRIAPGLCFDATDALVASDAEPRAGRTVGSLGGQPVVSYAAPRSVRCRLPAAAAQPPHTAPPSPPGSPGSPAS